jgi:L-Ala-D/L-Glu epimerase
MTPFALSYRTLKLEKRVPLTISRGTTTHSEVIWLRLSAGGQEGWGEAAEFSVDGVAQSLGKLTAAMDAVASILAGYDAQDQSGIEGALLKAALPSAARSAIDQAWWDWHGRRLQQPVWRLWSMDPAQGPVTSVTVGISEPASAQRRVQQWLELGDLRAFKIKLGSPAGIASDRAMFSAVAEVIPAGAKISVDANGGWTVEDAIAMSRWLVERGVDHLEQPLPRGKEHEVRAVRRGSPLPVILDESVFSSADIEPLVRSEALDGFNIKLMKCGGPSEALRMIAAARKHGLRILVGCYGNTALANTAGATLGPRVDYLDLDSHLNLKDDPFVGAQLREGRLVLPQSPGFGVSHDHAAKL